jgi:hypothetical protein
MKKVIFLSVLLVCTIGCKKELIEKPEDLIAKDKMTEILYDISLLYASKGVNTGQIDFQRVSIEDFIYKQYGVDSTQVANSTIYYSSKPDEYLKMYEYIQERLKAAKDTIIARRKALKESNAASEREKFKADSLERERELREFIDTNN